MIRHYDPAAARRETVIANNGTVLERKWLYGRPGEWDMLYRLASDCDLPLGRMLINLAYAEKARRQDDLKHRITRLG